MIFGWLYVTPIVPVHVIEQTQWFEAKRRTEITRSLLDRHMVPQDHAGLHVGMPMPTAKARDVVLAAARLNITLAPPEAFMADLDSSMAGLRLCLGTLPERDLRQALEIIVNLLAVEADIALALQPVA